MPFAGRTSGNRRGWTSDLARISTLEWICVHPGDEQLGALKIDLDADDRRARRSYLPLPCPPHNPTLGFAAPRRPYRSSTLLPSSAADPSQVKPGRSAPCLAIVAGNVGGLGVAANRSQSSQAPVRV